MVLPPTPRLPARVHPSTFVRRLDSVSFGFTPAVDYRATCRRSTSAVKTAREHISHETRKPCSPRPRVAPRLSCWQAAHLLTKAAGRICLGQDRANSRRRGDSWSDRSPNELYPNPIHPSTSCRFLVMAPTGEAERHRPLRYEWVVYEVAGCARRVSAERIMVGPAARIPREGKCAKRKPEVLSIVDPPRGEVTQPASGGCPN